MNKKKNISLKANNVYLLLAIGLILFSYAMYYLNSPTFLQKSIYENFQRDYKIASEKIKIVANEIAEMDSGKMPLIDWWQKLPILKSHLQENDAILYIYRSDSLICWTSTHITETDILSTITKQPVDLVRLTNGWYLIASKISVNKTKVVALKLVKNNYPIHNSYLNKSFGQGFNVPENIGLKLPGKYDEYLIKNNYGRPIAALDFINIDSVAALGYNVAVFFFILSWFFLFLYFNSLIKNTKHIKNKLIVILISGFLLLSLKFIMSSFKVPVYVYNLELFKPTHFAISSLIPSLGDLFLISCVIYFMVYSICREVNINLTKIFAQGPYFKIARWGLIVLLFASFLGTNNIFETIIYNSNINLGNLEMVNFRYFSIYGLLSIALLFAVFIFLTDWIIRTFFSKSDIRNVIIELFAISVLALVLYYFVSKDIEPAAPVLLLLTFIFIAYSRFKQQGKYKYAHILLLMLIFSFYSVYLIYHVTEIKSENESKTVAVSLSTEHDPVAEYLLIDLGKSIQNDKVLKTLATEPNLDYLRLYKHFKKNYFSGYWEKYELQITICNPYDSVLLRPDIVYQPCFYFFKNLLRKNAETVPNSDFYFLKNFNGCISYLTFSTYYNDSANLIRNIYVQLDSKLISEELGYPELLLDDRASKDSHRDMYSYARYYKNRLIYQSGTFAYKLSAENYRKTKNEYEYETFGKYEHLFYRPDENNLLILSKPDISFFDLLVSFSYIFIFYFFILNLVIIAIAPNILKLNYTPDFKTKIRLSMVGVLLLSLIIVGSISIYLSIKQYQSKHYEIVSEKLQSVLLEMGNRLGNEKELDKSWGSYEYDSLEELLRKLSNIFYTDVNLYDTTGHMIASSRPEIFEKGLSGNQMDPDALYQLTHDQKAEFMHEEQIGQLKFMSIYTPFVNNDNKLIAYLNLPYFTKQSTFSKELYSMLLAIVNFYVLLILGSIAFAVILSNSIVKPLQIIRERFASISLGTRNEKILYANNDEIGALVHQYNRMVDELDKNIELLARSERESAWREMAKQVAHEIKNPLTPMRLSVQQLLKAWNDKNENIDEYMQRVSQTLIEQIDTLSSIATEFSNFAKMPKANNQEIDLCSLLKSVAGLFAEEPVSINLHLPCDSGLRIYADKEQISRVFINLITNAIQAIPDNRQGVIDISVTQTKNKVNISVSDNGKGVEASIGDKLFEPNFTTKSGGMGMGLAISKNIIESAGGNIYYKTIENEGTTFIIDIPLFSNNNATS